MAVIASYKPYSRVKERQADGWLVVVMASRVKERQADGWLVMVMASRVKERQADGWLVVVMASRVKERGRLTAGCSLIAEVL